MSDQLTGIGNFLSSPSSKALFSVAGLGSNIAGAVENAQQQSQYNSAQSYLKNIITNPTAYNAAVQKYEQPLNQGLVTSVENATNAQLAERGLGSSGAITQSVLAQALAPYIQQNQTNAQSALNASLGSIGQLRPTGQNGFTDISKILAGLQAGKAGATTPAAGNPNGFAGTDPLGLNTPTPQVGTYGLGLPQQDPSTFFSDPSMSGAFAIPFVGS